MIFKDPNVPYCDGDILPKITYTLSVIEWYYLLSIEDNITCSVIGWYYLVSTEDNITCSVIEWYYLVSTEDNIQWVDRQ